MHKLSLTYGSKLCRISESPGHSLWLCRMAGQPGGSRNRSRDRGTIPPCKRVTVRDRVTPKSYTASKNIAQATSKLWLKAVQDFGVTRSRTVTLSQGRTAPRVAPPVLRLRDNPALRKRHCA
eukprot:7001983-Karenia_brevis.AAC.1